MVNYLEKYFEEAGIYPPYNDFEAIYAELSEKEEHKDLLVNLEAEIYQYFSGMELPDEPTLYDHLILSLREKDIIATFNWDPFFSKPLCETGISKIRLNYFSCMALLQLELVTSVRLKLMLNSYVQSVVIQ